MISGATERFSNGRKEIHSNKNTAASSRLRISVPASSRAGANAGFCSGRRPGCARAASLCALCGPQFGWSRHAGGAGAGQDCAADLLGVSTKLRSEVFDSRCMSCLSASATSKMWSTRSGKEVRARIALRNPTRGNNHHVEAFGLIECPCDVRFGDPAGRADCSAKQTTTRLMPVSRSRTMASSSTRRPTATSTSPTRFLSASIAASVRRSSPRRSAAPVASRLRLRQA